MILLGFVLSFGLVSSQDLVGLTRDDEFVCPHERGVRIGYYPDPWQCDKYYICQFEELAEAKLCPDGLIFNNATSPKLEQCGYPFMIERYCQDQGQLQPPTTDETNVCRRANGLYAHIDPTNCKDYYECVGGLHFNRTCQGERHFDEYSGECIWKRDDLRRECIEPVQQADDGFICPVGAKQFANGVKKHNTFHPDSKDCRYFYVCSKDEAPRHLGCPAGKVFNDKSFVCDDPANVHECKNYYTGAPAEYDQDVALA